MPRATALYMSSLQPVEKFDPPVVRPSSDRVNRGRGERAMLDGWVRRRINPPLDRLGQGLARAGISADAVTLAGLGLGLAAAGMIALQSDLAALVLFGLNRLL